MSDTIRAAIITITVSVIISITGVVFALSMSDSSLSKDVEYISKSVERIDVQHNGRIMSNAIAIEKVREEVTELRILVPEMAKNIEAMLSSMEGLEKSSLDTNVYLSILRDREARKEADGT
ncbi:MAG: hypothetical protein GY799_21400 [Desulfobulbaceae bacterium]|nr:hypothetical protein [Desulfobulbaceae bacterium]